MLKDIVAEYLVGLVDLINEMSPYLMMGFFFAGLLRVVFPRHLISRYMGQSNFRSVLNASLMGVPMPLCSCGVLPAGISFYRNGASRGSTVSFLISTPQTGVDSILATYSLLGLPLAIVRPVVALFTGIAGGLMGNGVDSRETRTGNAQVEQEKEYPRSVRELFRYGFVELLQEISKWLIIGLLVAALLSVLIPADFFTRNISSEYLAMLLILLASVPLYICATGSIPIAAVLMMKGLSPGAALVLLMAGPATNVATMAVIGKTMGRETLWVYMASIVGGALLFGILINELIPREWITGAIPSIAHSGTHGLSSGWFPWSMSVLLCALVINGYIQKRRTGNQVQKEDRFNSEGMKLNVHVFKVEGMTCAHCKTSVEKGLKELPSVSQVVAEPGTNTVTVEAESLEDEEIGSKIEKLGYIFRGRA